MSGEGARSGVMHPGPRARVASKPIPATQTILYWGLGCCFLIFFCIVSILGWVFEQRSGALTPYGTF